jgi:hypothetical protein
MQNQQVPNPLGHISKELVSLSLYRPNIFDSNDLVECLTQLGCLEQLSLYGVGCLDDNSLIKILKRVGPQLKVLNLGGYMVFDKKLTDESIKCISLYCIQLKSLGFNMFSSTSQFDALKLIFEDQKRAGMLEELCFSACRNIRYDLLMQMGLNCVNLQKLDLSGLCQLVDDDLLITVSNTSQRLKNLDIKGCCRVTDESIMSLAVKCPLECLVLAGIGSLTDKCIFTIANHLQSTLSEIYLSGCSKISSVALVYLGDCCIRKLYCEHRVPNKVKFCLKTGQIWLISG